MTKYLDDHPGGGEIIMEFAGKFADEMFEDIGHSVEAREKLKLFEIGSLEVCNLISSALLHRYIYIVQVGCC